MLAILLLPLYTRYLTPADYGAVETLLALTAVLVTLLRGGIQSAFFRFWFDSPEREHRLVVLRTSFWYTMAASTAGLARRLRPRRPDLGAAASTRPTAPGSSAPRSSCSGRR